MSIISIRESESKSRPALRSIDIDTDHSTGYTKGNHQANQYVSVCTFSRAFPHVYWLLEPEEITIAYLKISQFQPFQQQKMFVERLENGGLSKHILH